jgi:dipeptidyl aminopeptidase/acylaminoacyl peptidase
MFRIESLLSARLFVAPQWVGERIYFVSNLSGRLSLYTMRDSGSVPEPLLPPDITLQNPELISGYLYRVLPELNRILLMIDRDGDERYLPHIIPLEGGYPEPILTDLFTDSRGALMQCDLERNIAYFQIESLKEARTACWRVNLQTDERELLHTDEWGSWVEAYDPDHTRALLITGYTAGDNIVRLHENGSLHPLLGTPLEQRDANEPITAVAYLSGNFTQGGGVLLVTTRFDDLGGLAYFPLNNPEGIAPVTVNGLHHSGVGELEAMQHNRENSYRLRYNIDGVSWLYEGTFDESSITFTVERVVVGEGSLAGGVLEGIHYDKTANRYVLSFCSATMPTQLFTNVAGKVNRLTNERLLGIPDGLLSAGEDASFTSHDGLRISARLYLPSPTLGYEGKRPLVYYIHGGPQSQERPNFAWFSMPLIQFLTLSGFAVFVPNVRGSSGYGLNYMKRVLPQDERIDVTRAGVIGRSYGGYMTLTLAARHAELWRAAVDMFGPYDLFTFIDRIPETWKPYFRIAVGDPKSDRALLEERSPRTYIDSVSAPMLVIQGKNDPRVIEQESRDVVERLREQGKTVDYLMFENEGHDVLKYENRVTCYNAITDFFRQHLNSTN